MIKTYAISDLLTIYVRTIKWYLLHRLSLPRSPSERYKKVKVNEYYMYVDFKDRGISKTLFVHGTREKDQMDIIKDKLLPGTKVLDIGANIGYYVILESRIIGPSAKIIAYEPSKENCSLLRKNVELNNSADQVEINNAAVSNKSGTSRFYLSDKSNLHTLNPENYKSSIAKTEKPKFIDVATVDIYEIINKHRDVKFIRMDIEGHEVEVLERLADAMKDFDVYPDILFETHFSKYDSARHDMEGRLKRLFQLGYFPSVFVSHRMQIPKLRRRGYKPDGITPTDMTIRAIYKRISKEDAINFICNEKGSRAVFLKKGHMKTINVLVVSSKYEPEYAGSGLRARTTYKRLSEKFPIEYEVLTSSVAYNNCETYEVDGHRVKRIARKPFPLARDEQRKSTLIEKLKDGCNYLSEAVATWRYLLSNAAKFDIIHIFGKNWVTSATVTFAKIVKKPFIVELCNEVYTPHHYEPLLLRLISGKRFLKDTAIICISDMLREMCERHGYRQNVWCRPNPVDETKFFIDTQNKTVFRKKYTHFGGDDILLVCISKFRPSKNQIFLLDVLKRLPERFKLVLAGPIVESGPLSKRDQGYLKRIKEKIREYHLESRIKLEPRFIKDVDEYLKMSDVFLFPTTTEALGTPMLEAFSCGLPAVANRIRGVTDCWLEEGKNGFLSGLDADEFTEKVKKAAEIEQAVLRQKRDEVISQCSTKSIDEKYFDLIKGLINRTGFQSKS